jgi:hypothetical protein
MGGETDGVCDGADGEATSAGEISGEVMEAKVVLEKRVDQALAIQQVQLTVRSKPEKVSLPGQEMQPIRPVKPVQVEATVSPIAPPDPTAGALH